MLNHHPYRQGSRKSSSGPWQLQPDFTDYFNQLITDYEAQNPDVKVRWVDVPWADMQSKILTAVTAGTAPDVVNLNPDFGRPVSGEKGLAFPWMRQ